MKFLLFIVAHVFVVSLADAKDVLSDLLAETIQQLPEHLRSPEAIVEKRVSSLARFDSFSKIEVLVNSSWERDLPKIAEFAGSESEKIIYFKAAQKLSRRDYIRFLTAATPLVANGSISKQQFKWGAFPEAKHLREMWMENPPGDSLKNLAYQAGLIFPDDKNMKDFFDKVIAGQVAIDSIGKDEKSLSATPTTSQKTHAEVQRPDKRPSESPAERTILPNTSLPNYSTVGSLMQRIGKAGSLTFAGIVGIIIAAILIWRWKSKSTR